MSTKLRLLLDECVPEAVKQEIRSCSGVSSVEEISSSHPLGNNSTPDTEVVAYATRNKRILVTVEGRLNEKVFTICTHEGIIVINATRRHETAKARLFTRFMQSGERGRSGHAVTKLRLNRSERIFRTPDGFIESEFFDLD